MSNHFLNSEPKLRWGVSYFEDLKTIDSESCFTIMKSELEDDPNECPKRGFDDHYEIVHSRLFLRDLDDDGF